MEYNNIVSLFAKAKFEGMPLALSEEVQEYLSNLNDYKKFLQDIDSKYTELVNESKTHKENNSIEYQDALNEYNKLVEKYSNKLAEEKIIVGVSLEDAIKLDELKQYGVNRNLGYFLKEVQEMEKVISSPKKM